MHLFCKFHKLSRKIKFIIFFIEAKLPIHLQLGLNSTKDIFEDVKVKKKSKKRKAREVLEQVYFLLLRDIL